ncbi:MAG TPA: hypothetical protein PK156_10955 [Polyangium sp.]|nr:hypothetical protein [Polyangium sp.]
MAALTSEERLELLQTLRSDSGQAEVGGRIKDNFFPIAEHLRAFEPDVVLIVGDRGAGKTQLVRVAQDPDLRKAVKRIGPNVRLPKGQTEWLNGYPMKPGPAKRALDKFVIDAGNQGKTATQDFWCAYLMRVLKNVFSDDDRKRFSSLLTAPDADVEARVGDFLGAGTSAAVALDQLDKRLQDENRWVFVLYDELDTLYYSDWSAMGELIRGLIAFWAHHSRRWERIRPKIFLRTDFYRHHGSQVAGADIAKLAASRVELSWSDKNLYAMLIKHLINLNEPWFDYCSAAKTEKMRYQEDPILRRIPSFVKKEDARPLIERIVGKYMGQTKGKGDPFTWILDHLRDGNQKVSPRSLILLFEHAAVIEAGTMHATHTHVISHISLRNALDKVSDAYVTQAFDEFKWLPRVKECLESADQVPWESRQKLEIAFRQHWFDWENEDAEVRPPAARPKELVDLLLELGIVRNRTGEKFDVPDLYLKGLGLKRKGGVARRVRRST